MLSPTVTAMPGAPVKKLWNLKGGALFTVETVSEYRLRFVDAERDEVVFACDTLEEMMAWNIAIQTGILKNSGSSDVDNDVGVKESTIFLPAPEGVSEEDEVRCVALCWLVVWSLDFFRSLLFFSFRTGTYLE